MKNLTKLIAIITLLSACESVTAPKCYDMVVKDKNNVMSGYHICDGSPKSKWITGDTTIIQGD